MAETETAVQRETEIENRWVAGAVGGIVGGVGFGILLQFVMGIMPVIGALYGVESLLAGWIAHLFNSLVFGLVYAGLAATPRFAAWARDVGRGAGLGAAYGVVLWIVAAGIVMPIWLDVVGFASPPPLPNLTVMGLIGHLVYGVLLGVVFVAMVRR